MLRHAPCLDARLHTRITMKLKKRLQYAIVEREKIADRRVTESEILCELGEHLPPHPDESRFNGKKAPAKAVKARKAS